MLSWRVLFWSAPQSGTTTGMRPRMDGAVGLAPDSQLKGPRGRCSILRAPGSGRGRRAGKYPSSLPTTPNHYISASNLTKDYLFIHNTGSKDSNDRRTQRWQSSRVSDHAFGTRHSIGPPAALHHPAECDPRQVQWNTSARALWLPPEERNKEVVCTRVSL